VVALGHPDAPGARRIRRTFGREGTLVLGRPDLEDSTVFRALAAAQPDVLLSWFWPRKIPGEVLALPPRGAFGVHPSLLPRWRGPDPYYWAIASGDEETGVTLHRLDEAYDTGPVITQRRVDIGDGDDAWSLARKLDRPGLALLGHAARRLAAGDALEGTPQPEEGATDAPPPSPEDLAVDWRADTTVVLRSIRAAAPEPGATADFAGAGVDVLKARPYAGVLPAALEVAEARCIEGGVAVRTGDGAVLVTVVRLGDERIAGGDLHRLFSPTRGRSSGR